MTILRDYQVELIAKVKQRIDNGEREIVIGACPSSGKTEVAIQLITDLHKNYPRVLLLTHGTNVIKDQWNKRLPISLLPHTTVLLHQNLAEELKTDIKFLNKFDMLVIDEAHEFTFGKIMGKNLSSFKKKPIIYLTGTPSKFIARGSKPEIVAALDLIPLGFISDLYVSLFSSNAKFLSSDLNQLGNAKASGIRKLDRNINADLEKLLESMFNRLKATGMTKGNPTLSSWTKSIKSMGTLGKTLIATDSIESAKRVATFFTDKGVSTLTSNSDNDKDSLEVKKFVEGDAQVLVVVNRCVLGFNLEKLVNVVDMTGSHNIDRIYQLYARVMRIDTSNKNTKKYFFKLVPENMSDYYKFYMTASLCLMNKEFISKYNGKNLNGMEIPVKMQAVKQITKGETIGKKNQKAKIQAIDELFEDTVNATQLLTNVLNKQGQELNEYAFCRIGLIKQEAFGIVEKRQIVNITEENLRYMIETGEIDERIYTI